MKQALFLCIALLAGSLLPAQTWNQKTNVPDTRYDGVAFSISGKVYYGLGITFAGNMNHKFYVFDPATNQWDTAASFPGVTRRMAFSFAVNGKGYIGMGLNPDSAFALQDVWEYDPILNSWSQKNDFPGIGRGFSVSLATAAKGYVGMGLDYMIFLADWWEYNPVNDTWSPKLSFPGGQRYWAGGFVLGDSCYVTGGMDINGLDHNDCWRYDPQTNTWAQRASVGSAGLTNPTAFSIGGTGYCGYGGTGLFYAYNAALNSWSGVNVPSNGVVTYDKAVATSTAGYCIENYTFTPDCWEFLPSVSASVGEMANENMLLFPNPSSGAITIQSRNASVEQLRVYDATGQLMLAKEAVAENTLRLEFSPGVYFLEVQLSDGKLVHQRFVIE